MGGRIRANRTISWACMARSGEFRRGALVFGRDARFFTAGPMIFLPTEFFETPIVASMLRRALVCSLGLVFLGSCLEDDDEPAELCGPQTDLRYLRLDALSSDPWFYRRTIVANDGPFTGLGDLHRVRFTADQNKLAIIDDQDETELVAWDLERRVDLLCSAEGVWVESEAAPLEEREYVVVDWSDREGGMTIDSELEGFGGRFASDEELEPWRRISESYLEVTERGELTVELEACAALQGGFRAPEHCGGAAELRHALLRVDAAGEYSGKLAAASPDFPVFSTAGGYLQRVAPDNFTYYLSPGAPAELVALASNYQPIFSNFSIRENNCSPAGLAAAVIARPALATLPELLGVDLDTLSGEDLSAACNHVEREASDIFTWQRAGDLRFNTITFVDSSSSFGWGSYSARAVDAANGEILASDLFVDGGAIARIVARVEELLSDGDPAIEGLLALAEARAAVLKDERYPLDATIRASLQSSASAAIGTGETLARYAMIDGSPAEELSSDRTAARFLLGPLFEPGDPVPDALQMMATPLERLNYLLDEAGRAEIARLLNAGYDVLDRLAPHGYEAVALELAMLPSAERSEILSAALAKNWVLHGLGHALGLADNLAASSDVLNYPAEYWNGDPRFAFSSVMDLLPGARSIHAVALGNTDIAALRSSYLDETAVFASPLPDLRFAAAAELQSYSSAAREFVGEAGAPVARLVPFASCGAEAALLQPDLGCAVLDFGSNPREIFANQYYRWLSEYPFTHLVEDTATFDAEPAFRPAIEALRSGSVALQYLGYYLSSEPSFAGSAREQELVDVSRQLANYAVEIMSFPETGRMCPWPGLPVKHYIPYYYLNEYCAPSVDITSATATTAGAIDIPFGSGRDSIAGIEEGTEGWTRVGSRVDRLNVLLAANLPFPTALPAGAQRLTLSRTSPVYASLLESFVLTIPGLLTAADIARQGSYWCFDAGPDQPYIGHVEPRRAITTAASPASPSSSCHDPAPIFTGIPAQLAGAALVSWFADLDTPAARIYVLGVDDGDVDWSSYPPTEVCEAEDIDGLVYRSFVGEDPVSCSLLETLNNVRYDWQAYQNASSRERYVDQQELVQGARALRDIYRF